MSLGKKHKCSNCSKPFYDLGKFPITCPNCGTVAKSSRKFQKKRNLGKDQIDKRGHAPGASVLIATIQNEIFRSDDSDFLIFGVIPPGETDTVSLKGSQAELKRGELIIASGEWIEDPKYGKQFSYNYFASLDELPLNGLKQYLSSSKFSGVGQTLANRIVNEHGNDSFTILTQEPEKLSEIEGVNDDMASQISANWKEDKVARYFSIFSSELKLRKNVQTALIEEFDNEFLKVIFEAPYSLIESITGVGFRIADDIAIRLGLDRKSGDRITSALEFVLKNSASRDGNCGLPLERLIEKSVEILEIEPGIIESAIEDGLANNFTERHSIEGLDVLFLTELYDAEKKISDKCISLVENDPIVNGAEVEKYTKVIENGLDFEPTGNQLEAIQSSLGNGLSIITGGPGVGKTTIIMGLVVSLIEAKIEFALCAPTGRAAKRLSEASGQPATTLHRLLEFSPFAGFKKDASNQLDHDIIICDEASMIDVELMAALMNALKPKVSLILVGDIDQLPPVGPGQPFRDIIQSGKANVCELIENFRQAEESGIPAAAYAINNGLPPKEGSDVMNDDFNLINRNDGEGCVAAVLEILNKLRDLRGGKFNLKDVQILTPMNKGPIGTTNLNHLIQNTVNPSSRDSFKIMDYSISKKDRVIQKKNNYEKNVFNGDIGYVSDINLSKGELTVNFDGNYVKYDTNEAASNLLLAYAITIHKSQGSEYPVVILLITHEHQYMLARNLIYTGLTRGKEIVFLIGQRDTLNRASKKTSSTRRWTALPQLLEIS
jgi:exodeoxyribonuclease V alpha subunit